MKVYLPNYSKAGKKKHLYQECQIQVKQFFFQGKRKRNLRCFTIYHVPKCGGNYTMALLKKNPEKTKV